jgi:hypothetical protein
VAWEFRSRAEEKLVVSLTVVAGWSCSAAADRLQDCREPTAQLTPLTHLRERFDARLLSEKRHRNRLNADIAGSGGPRPTHLGEQSHRKMLSTMREGELT